jgi:hypothetical protein
VPAAFCGGHCPSPPAVQGRCKVDDTTVSVAPGAAAQRYLPLPISNLVRTLTMDALWGWNLIAEKQNNPHFDDKTTLMYLY